MAEVKFEMRAKARDNITGTTGIVTGRAEYLGGSTQYRIASSDTTGKLSENWIEEARLDPVADETPAEEPAETAEV